MEIIPQAQEGLTKLNDDIQSYDGEDAAEKARLEGIAEGYQKAVYEFSTFVSLV